jgi:transcriptional regulator with XRE-family HTH domain
MSSQRLDNYLRAHRKNSGLTQEEVAFLLGFDNANLVSRYEKRQRMPPVQTALAYEAIFGIPIAELFAGMQQQIVSDVEKRRSELSTRLRARDPKGIAAPMMKVHKLRSLASDEQSMVTNQNTAGA